MANTCRPQIQACAIRVARLEPNGVPDPGANNLYVSDALISMGLANEITEGNEIEVVNACGVPCVSFKDNDKLKRITVNLQICTPDPELTELLSGGVVLQSAEKVGYGFPELNQVINENGTSIEVWAKRVTSDGILDPVNPYAWWVFPKVFLRPLEATFENGAFLPTFGGFAVANPNWYNGPANDWPLPNNSDRVAQWIPSSTLPTASCGYQTLAST